ncbi:MAG TPA: hypothetical protein VJ783_23880 [Pirellulales bacterium]|nr:hypothetical protein [Pirellulales bacterium]
MAGRIFSCRWLAAALALVGFSGCGRSLPDYARYVPSAARAQDALEQVLSAWKDGRPAGPLASKFEPVTIQVADSRRKPGQRLVDYELLGEISGDGPRTFVVRLKLANPTDQLVVRYYLVGIDPLWVFRQEDFEAVMHWAACAPDDESQPEALAADEE